MTLWHDRGQSSLSVPRTFQALDHDEHHNAILIPLDCSLFTRIREDTKYSTFREARTVLRLLFVEVTQALLKSFRLACIACVLLRYLFSSTTRETYTTETIEGNTDPVRSADDQASADTTAGTVSMGQADATAETNFTTGTEASVQNNTNDKCIALDTHSTFTPQSDPIIERQLYNRDLSGNAHVATITNAIICSES
jgi:hypothetical protein